MSRHNPFEATEAVPLVDIVVHPSWQVRKGLTASAVDRYAAIYKVGGAMEPIRLAQVQGSLVLIDGAHRMAALRGLGVATVEATITPMREMEAQWAAAAANMEHGVPLKKAELRTVFRQYVATGQHRKGRGRVKSLRDIVKDIPGVTVGTVRNWFLKDHPDLYRKSYAGSAADGHSRYALAESKAPSQRQQDMQAISDLLRQAAALAGTLQSRKDRQQVMQAATDLLTPLL